MENPMTTRWRIALFLTLVSVQFAWAQQPPPGSKKLAFDQDSVGSPPAGFEFARTGQGAEGKWIVRADADKPGNHVLVQESSDPTTVSLSPS